MDFTIVSQIHRPLSFGDSFDLLFPSKSRWISQNLPKSIDFSYFWLDVLFVRDTSVRKIVAVLPVWDRHDTSCVFQTGLDVLSLRGHFAPQTGLDVFCVTPRSETLSRCFHRTPLSHRSVFLPVHRVCFIGSAAQTREPVNSRRATHAAVSALSIARPCLGLPQKKDFLLEVLFCGAPNRARTCDTAVNSRVLYRLSY